MRAFNSFRIGGTSKILGTGLQTLQEVRFENITGQYSSERTAALRASLLARALHVF